MLPTLPELPCRAAQSCSTQRRQCPSAASTALRRSVSWWSPPCRARKASSVSHPPRCACLPVHISITPGPGLTLAGGAPLTMRRRRGGRGGQRAARGAHVKRGGHGAQRAGQAARARHHRGRVEHRVHALGPTLRPLKNAGALSCSSAAAPAGRFWGVMALRPPRCPAALPLRRRRRRRGRSPTRSGGGTW